MTGQTWEPKRGADPERTVETASTRTANSGEAPASHPAPSAILFRWGHLEVLEKVGQGGGGEVYRAYDPRLDTEVALKLHRRTSLAPVDADRFLAEARRLARVRHPNVLAVRGADEHDARVGLWTDFIRGRSLEEQIRDEGPLSALEAATIGLELCRALAAVHAKGLIHRDIKTSNVMREIGGRILLTDFGSVQEMEPSGSSSAGDLRGTPIFMAPEQLEGRPATPRTDIYALGVLLYRLVTCSYPIEAYRIEDLLNQHRSGSRIPLRDRRPDLPLPFVRVVEQALANDPKERFESAGAMERALSASAEGLPGSRVPADRRARSMAWAAGALVLAGLLVWAPWHRPPRADHAGNRSAVTVPPTNLQALEASASLGRRVGDQDQHLGATGSTVGPGDHLFLELRPREAMYTYIFNEDEAGVLHLLFPLAGVAPSNPLASGIRYRLPGRVGDNALYWTVTSVGGREQITVIGSRDPLPDVEGVIARMPPASPNQPIHYGQVDPAALSRFRSLGGLVQERGAGDTHTKLHDALQALRERRNARGDVWIWHAELANPGI